MSNELTRCPVCKRILVGQDIVHAVEGNLYCSRNCAVQYLMDDYIQNAKEMAIEAYNDGAEIVAVEDILSEEMQEVKITVTCTKVIRLPKNLSAEQAIETATQLYNDGTVVAEPDDCDKSNITYELVSNKNSAYSEEG